jgi:outer membrane biosynthesis protein TonB
VGCIFLSLYIIFFAWNPKEDLTKTETQPKTEVSKNIPSIDKIWNNALPVVKQPVPKKEEKIENVIKQIISVEPPKKAESPKVVQVQKVTTTPKITKVPLTKVTSAPKKTVINTSTKQQTINAQAQITKTTEDAAKKKAEAERKAAEEALLNKLKAEQAKKAAEEQAKQAAASKQEFVNYKAQLRNTIGRKIDFTRVIGDGNCTVAFKIDQNGRLINRSFAKQSSNNTLNDAVYAAVMATPTFNPPPSVYKNETLNLNIRFSNGNFEISLP